MPKDKKRLWRKGEAYYDTKPTSERYSGKSTQTIGNVIRTFELYDNDGIDDDDPWSGILATVMAAVVFGRDAIINTKFIADWDYIRQRKQNIIRNNNERENAKRIPHMRRSEILLVN